MNKIYSFLIFFGVYSNYSNAQTNPYLQGDQCVTDISISYRTVSIFTSDGEIYTWGNNEFGQIGNGNAQSINVPYLRPSIPDFSAISHGYYSSSGLTKDGKIYTWGTNTLGVLGDGTTTDNFTPTQVGTDTDWIKVVNTWVNNIALKSNGTLWGWGNNGCALGNGSVAQYAQPIQISPDTDWVNIGAGTDKTFAIKSNGTLWAMGKNHDYVLGISNSYHAHCVSTLTQVGTDTDWKKVVPSNIGKYTLALKTDNTLWYWGTYNENFFTAVQTPVQIGTDTWKEIAAGTDSAVGIKNDGTLWQWGAGCWGNGWSVIIPENSSIPVQVGTENNWIKVGAGYCMSFAVRADNTVWAFGANYTDFFDGTLPSPATPVLVFQCATSSVSEHELSDIILYPNPTTDKIFWAQNIMIEKVTIYDMNGKQVLSENITENSIDVSHLASGTYLIKLESNKKLIYNSKFVKQ